MAESDIPDVVIIGAGMAGLSTAIWARRLGLSALVLEREMQAGGQLTMIRGRIVDYPGLDLPEGGALAERLVRQAAELGADLQLDNPVKTIDAANRRCVTARGNVAGRALVIATGITPRQLEVPGEADLYRAHLVRRPSHDYAWFQGRRVAVIGGGDRAAENALMLRGAAAQIHLIHRGESLRARASLTDPIHADSRIALHYGTRVQHVTVNGNEAVITAEQGDQLVRFTVDAVCIYIGNRPNTTLVDGQLDLTDEGYILTDRTGQSSLPGVYAVGDVCTLPPFQALVTAAGQAMVVAKQIALRHAP